MISPAEVSRLAGTSAAASGRRVMSAPSTSLRDGRQRQAEGGHQPHEDQATGPPVERTDQQHDAAGADDQGGVRRVGDRGAGQVQDPEHADAECGQRHGEPEQDRAAPARVAWPREVRRGDGHRRTGRRRGESSRGRVGNVRDRRRTGAGLAVPVEEDQDQQGDQRDQRQRPREAELSDGVTQDEQRGDRADHDEGDGPVAVVEAERGAGRAVLGEQQPARAVQQQPGAAEEDEHHEGDPQDDGVDVEVAGQAAGDARDLAVRARGATDPAEVPDLLAGRAGSLGALVGAVLALVGRGWPGRGVGWSGGHGINSASSARPPPSGTTLKPVAPSRIHLRVGSGSLPMGPEASLCDPW